MAPLSLLLVATAWGKTPAFSAHDPQLAEAARTAWLAVEQCAGWPGFAHEVVEISRDFVPGGYVGGAQIDAGGLARVILSPHSTERALIHEIAHAWAWSGPATLTEGRTDLLADCAVARVPGLGPLDPDPGRELDYMPDLRHWTVAGDGMVADPEALKSDAYLAAGRLMRLVATVIDPKALWPRDGHLDWERLEGLLGAAGAPGHMILAVIDGGAERQRHALSDRDRDGVPWLAEILEGTNPDRWDSDGDGWWDGAPLAPSVAAVPIPQDGTVVCSGLAGGSVEGSALVLAYGALRGSESAAVAMHAGYDRLPARPGQEVTMPPSMPLLLSLEGSIDQVTGGLWAIAGGRGMVLDWNCRSTPSYTVWVRDARAAPVLDEFAQALELHLARAESTLDAPSKRRAVVVLGAGAADIRDGEVRISPGWVEWAQEQDRVDALAGVAVALHRVWEHGPEERRWDTAEALTRAILDEPPDLTFVAVDLGLVSERTADAIGCTEGWLGLLSGKCRD